MKATHRNEVNNVKYPKLKNALLCRILVYIVVLSAFILPIVIIFCLGFVPINIRGFLALAICIGMIVYLFKNFVVLLFLDCTFSLVRCYNTARTWYALPRHRSVRQIERSISRYGKKCPPAPIMPQPTELRYRFCHPLTVYSSGIEKVIAAYHTDYLDADKYRAIFSSAKTNSKALIKKKKALFLDKNQKKAPLNRVTVLLIFAQKVEENLSDKLYELVCKQCGDKFEDVMIPCVIDMEQRGCVFNCFRLPYIGFGYPAQNRGCRLVKRIVFGGRLRLAENDHFVEPVKDLDPEESLWVFWRNIHNEFVGSVRKMKKQFASMSDRAIVLDDDTLYIKWGKRGVCLSVQLDALWKRAMVEDVHSWSYPTTNLIAKKTAQEIRQKITGYFAEKGYVVAFSDEPEKIAKED